MSILTKFPEHNGAAKTKLVEINTNVCHKKSFRFATGIEQSITPVPNAASCPTALKVHFCI